MLYTNYGNNYNYTIIMVTSDTFYPLTYPVAFGLRRYFSSDN